MFLRLYRVQILMLLSLYHPGIPGMPYQPCPTYFLALDKTPSGFDGGFSSTDH